MNNDGYRTGVDMGHIGSVFQRRQKTERLDWKILATADVDKIAQQNDIKALRDNIKHVAFCDIEYELDVRDSDKNLVKLFKLTQLMVDYLLSSQDYLVGVANAAEERCAAMMEEREILKQKQQETEQFIQEIKRECHRRKRLILAQQQIMDSGPNTHHRCPYCEKAFLNRSFLQAHLEKRHADRYIRWSNWASTDGDGGHKDKQDQGRSRLEIELLAMMERMMNDKHGRTRSPGTGGGSDIEALALLQQQQRDHEKERHEWQRAMRKLEAEIDDLRNRLNMAPSNTGHISPSRSLKTGPQSHLRGDLEDDEPMNQHDMEQARLKAIQDHKKKSKIVIEQPIVKQRSKSPKKHPENVFTDESVKKSFDKEQTNLRINDDPDKTSLNKALGLSHGSKQSGSIYSLYNTLSVSIMGDVDDISLSVPVTNHSMRESNNNDCSFHESTGSSTRMFDSCDISESVPMRFRAINSSSSAMNRSRGSFPMATKTNTERRESPQRLSPRPTNSSPVHRNSIVDKELPIRDSYVKTSNLFLDNLDTMGIDFSQDLIDKFCDEVRHMLDDHLELHGIPKGTKGISGAILNDKLKLLDHEQNQLKSKYVNYDEIRRRLEVEVDKQAENQLKHDSEKQYQPHHSTRLTSPDHKINDRLNHHLSSRSLHSSHSDWDQSRNGRQSVSPVRDSIQMNVNTEYDNNRASSPIHHHNHNSHSRSPSASPTRRNIVQKSTDLSNTFGSSNWPTESKAVTSVRNKQTLTNRSSDYDDESDFSTR